MKAKIWILPACWTFVAFLGLPRLGLSLSLSLGQEPPQLSDAHRSWLERDVAYIITDREREAFVSLESIEERDRFIEAFWKRRDPNRSTPFNEFQIEHFRRIEHANEFLGRETFREGWQTDRGRYYILLGEPVEIQRYDGYNQIVASELWFFQGDRTLGLPAQFYLLFFRENDLGEYKLYRPAVDGPLALLRQGRSRPGMTEFIALEELRGISTELARASLSFDTSEPANLRTGRASLGTDLLIANIEASPKRSIGTGHIDAWLQYGNRVSAEYSFNFVPSRSVFAVLAGPDATPVVHFSVEMDPENFALETDEDQSKFFASLELTVEVRSTEGALVLARDNEAYVELSPDQAKQIQALPFAYQGNFPLIAGDYTVTVIVRNRVVKQYTVAERELRVEPPDATASAPSLSDVVLAFDYDTAEEGGDGRVEPFRFGSMLVQPSADHLFSIGDTAYLLTRVVGAYADQRVTFDLLNGERVARSVEGRAGEGGIVLAPLTLEGLEGGDYQLRAELRSRGGGVTLRKSVPLTVSPRSVLLRPGFSYRQGFDASVPGIMALSRGQQLWNLGRFGEARGEFEQAVARGGRRLPVAWWKLAYAYLREEDADRALELLVPMEQPFPNHYEVIAGLGLAYHLRQDYPRCVRYLTRARVIRQPDTTLLNALGDAQRALSNIDAAREAFERSLELEPEQEAIQRALASLGAGRPDN